MFIGLVPTTIAHAPHRKWSGRKSFSVSLSAHLRPMHWGSQPVTANLEVTSPLPGELIIISLLIQTLFWGLPSFLRALSDM